MTVPEQGELFQAETSWFHVFRAMVESGDVAKLGPHAVTCYLVIKSYANWSTGRAFPALETIAAKAGVSLAQVKRSLTALEAQGYIVKEKRGRNNCYALREKVEVLDGQGRPTAVATWDYLPNSVREAQAELKNFLMSGKALDGGVVHIERLTINVFRDNAQQVNITTPAEALDAMRGVLGKKGSL
jgi:DNA-binding transcriptional MocR family regulator